MCTVSIMEFEKRKCRRETQYFGDPFDAPSWRAQWGRAEAGGVFPIQVGERLPQAVQDIAICGLENLLPAKTKCSSSRQISNLPNAYQSADCSVGWKCDTGCVKRSRAAEGLELALQRALFE